MRDMFQPVISCMHSAPRCSPFRSTRNVSKSMEVQHLVVQQIQRAAVAMGTAHFDVSANGTLVYLPGQFFQPKGSFVYRSRDGDIRPITGESEDGARMMSVKVTVTTPEFRASAPT